MIRKRLNIDNSRELKAFLQHGDLLVLNDTQVLPARRFSDDGAVEFLFLERLAPCRWKCLVSPGRKMRIGATVRIDNVTLCVDTITPEGERIVVLNKDIDLYSGGSMPLPPYIRRDSNIEDAARYQTVFAHAPGALAAPTAGLHFTSEILNEIPHTFVTLHVGTGTFLPVRSENVTEHRMHAERFSISAFRRTQNQQRRANRGRGDDRGPRIGVRRARPMETWSVRKVPRIFSFIRHISFGPSTFF